MLGCFALILSFALVVVTSRTVDVTTTASVSNAAPTVGTVYLNDSATWSTTDTYNASNDIDLTQGSTKTIYAHALVTDTNGADDIVNGGLDFYRADKEEDCSFFAETPAPDKNFCYLAKAGGGVGMGTCTIAAASATTTRLICPIPLEYFTDPGEWWARVTVLDAANATGGDSTQTDIAELLALSFPASLAYDATALGGTSGEEIYEITQYGNVAADAQVRGGALTCDVGSIPVGNQDWSLEQYDNFVDLTASDVYTGLDIAARTNDSVVLSSVLFWKLTVPADGVSGDCTGTTVFTAITPEV